MYILAKAYRLNNMVLYVKLKYIKYSKVCKGHLLYYIAEHGLMHKTESLLKELLMTANSIWLTLYNVYTIPCRRSDIAKEMMK